MLDAPCRALRPRGEQPDSRVLARLPRRVVLADLLLHALELLLQVALLLVDDTLGLLLAVAGDAARHLLRLALRLVDELAHDGLLGCPPRMAASAMPPSADDCRRERGSLY